MILWKTAILIALCKAVRVVPDTILDNVSKTDLAPCEEDWKQYGQNCFKVEKKELNWRDASKECRSMGGYLASVHSKEQNEFLEALSQETRVTRWWIGLHNFETGEYNDGVYDWDDGSDVDYSNWRDFEPAGNYIYTGDCVTQGFLRPNDGEWYIKACSRKLPYLCQKKIQQPQ